MTTLLQMLKRAAAYPRLKRAADAAGYSLLQQTHTHAGNNRGRGYAAAVAFGLICVLLAQRRNHVASISKNLNEAVEKMNELTEVVHSLRDLIEAVEKMNELTEGVHSLRDELEKGK